MNYLLSLYYKCLFEAHLSPETAEDDTHVVAETELVIETIARRHTFHNCTLYHIQLSIKELAVVSDSVKVLQ